MISYLFPYSQSYLWIDVLLLKESSKGILIEFDGRKVWLPKAWIIRIKRNKTKAGHCEQAISIKIFEYHWAKKF